MEQLELRRKKLRGFGFLMGFACFAFALFSALRHGHIHLALAVTGGIFFFCALSAPGILRPAYVLWMRLAYVLSWVNTRLILILVFYLVFTPYGLLMRLFGNDPLERRLERGRGSYWIKKERGAFTKEPYERQF